MKMIAGDITFFIGGAGLWGFYVMHMVQWLGVLGGLVAIPSAPVALFLPLIYTLVEGTVSVLYFGLLGVALAGGALSASGRG